MKIVCMDCRKDLGEKAYPKAENCIQCYRNMKKQHIRLVSDIRLILATTGHIGAGERIWKRLDGEDA